ncbi:uncharacterized, partial [Tachysurus ichikawai]
PASSISKFDRHMQSELNAIGKRGVIITPKFIHSSGQRANGGVSLLGQRPEGNDSGPT